MFVIACKETGCVKLTCTEDPRNVMNLSSNIFEHFDVLEFNDNTNYSGKYLKVINGALVDLGYLKDIEKSGALEDCNNCPSLFE